MNKNNLSENRIFYYDCLRVFATLAVMLLHVSASNWSMVDVRTFEWQVFNIGDAISRFGVPIFIMISGALFLKENVDTKIIYKKHILRIVVSFVFWSTIYAFVDLYQGAGNNRFLVNFVQGHYHMWFLYMIVGLYMLVPLLRRISESQESIQYFLLLTVAFTFLVPQIIDTITLWDKEMGGVLSVVVEKIHFHFTLGYVSYFVLGYYLSKTDISKKTRTIIYIFSILSFIFTIGASSFISIYLNEARGDFYSNFTTNVFLESVGVFVFFKYNAADSNMSDKIKIIISRLSKYSFGAYLVHALVLEQMDEIVGMNTLICNPILAIVVIMVLVFTISYLISYGINKIPFLNKYIV